MVYILVIVNNSVRSTMHNKMGCCKFFYKVHSDLKCNFKKLPQENRKFLLYYILTDALFSASLISHKDTSKTWQKILPYSELLEREFKVLF